MHKLRQEIYTYYVRYIDKFSFRIELRGYNIQQCDVSLHCSHYLKFDNRIKQRLKLKICNIQSHNNSCKLINKTIDLFSFITSKRNYV